MHIKWLSDFGIKIKNVFLEAPQLVLQQLSNIILSWFFVTIKTLQGPRCAHAHWLLCHNRLLFLWYHTTSTSTKTLNSEADPDISIKGAGFFSFRKSDFKKFVLRKIKWYRSIIQTEDYNYNLAQKRIRLCNCLQQVEDYFKLF